MAGSVAPIFLGMESPSEQRSGLPRFDRRFLRNVSAAAFLGVCLGLLVAGASLVSAVLVAVAVAAIFALVFAVWGSAREGGE
jgi:hypothetical protein